MNNIYKELLEEIEALKQAADRLAGLLSNDDLVVLPSVRNRVRRAAAEITNAVERVDH